jgi:L,D-transpeptidase ErfK/SrfK
MRRRRISAPARCTIEASANSARGERAGGRKATPEWATPAALLAAPLLAAFTAQPALSAELSLAPGVAAAGAIGSYVTPQPDTLLDVARRFDLGYVQLLAANPEVDPWLPGRHPIVLPSFYLLPDAPHQGIVINLAEERLFYYVPSGDRVVTAPIGIAVDGAATPLGRTRVTAKQQHPTWYPPASIRAEEPGLPAAIPPGPDNPLGDYALVLGWPGYLIHGTNKPDGVGRHVSHGCIRLYPEDIASLYRQVPIGTPVTVVDQPVVLRWIGDALLLAVHPTRTQAEAIETGATPEAALPPELVRRVLAAAGDSSASIDWGAVERAGLERSGIPVQVALRHATLATGLSAP